MHETGSGNLYQNRTLAESDTNLIIQMQVSFFIQTFFCSLFEYSPIFVFIIFLIQLLESPIPSAAPVSQKRQVTISREPSVVP